MIFTSTVSNGLKATLEKVVDDKGKAYESSIDMTKWMEVRSMKDAFEDDAEYGGPGLAHEVTEGAAIPTGTIYQGYLTRYWSRKFGLKLVITEEAVEDNKYDEIIRAGGRLERALWKTVDIDATLVAVRMFNTDYTGGDGLPLCSASHTLPGGGTFSNVMATPMSPSRIAFIAATTQIRLYPGHDGITEGYQPEKIICPMAQWAVWDGIVGSEKAPEPGQFNEINVVHKIDPTIVPLKFWNNTTTNWALLTDCDQKINWRWRRKAKTRTWVDNDQELMKHSRSARWSRGWSDPRAVLGVQA
jgi:hypothetical protein